MKRAKTPVEIENRSPDLVQLLLLREPVTDFVHRLIALRDASGRNEGCAGAPLGDDKVMNGLGTETKILPDGM